MRSLLTAFNAVSLVSYFVYKKYIIKLGLNTPEKFKAHVEHFNALEKRTMELTLKLKITQNGSNLFYNKASRLKSIAQIEAYFVESQLLAGEIQIEIEYAEVNEEENETLLSENSVTNGQQLAKLGDKCSQQPFGDMEVFNKTFEPARIA